MADITFGTPSQPPVDTNDGTQTWSHTVAAGDNRVLVVCAGSRRRLLDICTYDGVALTPVFAVGLDNGGEVPHVHMWIMVDPPVGTADVVVGFSTGSNSRPRPGAIVLYGVDQTTPHRTHATSTSGATAVTSSDVDVPSEAGDAVIDVCCTANSSVTSEVEGSGQTKWFRYRLNPTTFNTDAFGSRKTATSTTTNMSWSWTTSAPVSNGGVAFIPAEEGDIVFDPTNVTSNTEIEAPTWNAQFAVDTASVVSNTEVQSVSWNAQFAIDATGLTSNTEIEAVPWTTQFAIEPTALTSNTEIQLATWTAQFAVDTTSIVSTTEIQSVQALLQLALDVLDLSSNTEIESITWDVGVIEFFPVDLSFATEIQTIEWAAQFALDAFDITSTTELEEVVVLLQTALLPSDIVATTQVQAVFFELEGFLVATGSFTAGATSHQITPINLSAFPPGLFTIRVKRNGGEWESYDVARVVSESVPTNALVSADSVALVTADVEYLIHV